MFVIAYDIGTTGIKTCLFELGETLRLLSGEYEGYGLYILPDGGAEQDADEWWEAMRKSTRRLIEKTGIDPKKIEAYPSARRCRGSCWSTIRETLCAAR